MARLDKLAENPLDDGNLRGNPQIEDFAALAGCDAWSIESPDRSMAPEEMLLQVMHQAGVHLPDPPPAAVTDTDVTPRPIPLGTVPLFSAPPEDNDVPLVEAMASNPMRRPDWKWLRALDWVRSGNSIDAAPRSRDDGEEGVRWIRAAADFYRAWSACRSERDQARLAQTMPAIYWARRLYHDDSPTRWAMEAYLLCRETDAQIGFLLGCPPEVVEAFEAVFFDVRSKLQHPDYIINVAIGPQIHQGVGSRDIGALWKLLGYQGGPYVVDSLIGKCRSREKSARKPEQTGDFFREASCDNVLMKTALTALSMPIPCSAKQQMKLLKQLPQVIKVAASPSGEAGPGDLEEAISAMMEHLPFDFQEDGTPVPRQRDDNLSYLEQPESENTSSEEWQVEQAPVEDQPQPTTAQPRNAKSVSEQLTALLLDQRRRPDETYMLYHSRDRIDCERFDNVQAMIGRLRDLEGQKIYTRIALGTQFGLTGPPCRYLITPLGSLRVTELPEIDDLAEEADGYMGEVFPELTIPLAAQSERGAYRGHIDQMDDL